jgi:predicted acyltransferase
MNAMNADANAAPAEGRAEKSSGRLMSLDALRGFDMFWIVGAEEIVHALRKISEAGVPRFLAAQMSHKDWAGFAFYDLIFPMFVFIVGVSLVFSLGKLIEKEGRASACKRLLQRAAMLYILGIFYYGGFGTPFEKIRLLGVLQRIALCYLFAGLVFCFFKTRGRIVVCLSLLLGYWALMTFVPVPEVGAGNFVEGKNLANYVDKQYLPLRKWDGDHDPEGLLSTLPAIAGCLLGVFAGGILKNGSIPAAKKTVYLLAGGVILLALGWTWNLQFPVIKKLWTSSFVLVSGGYSCLLLAAFYQVVDVWKWQSWAQPFVWIGMNPITIYMAHNLVDFNAVAQRFVGGDLNRYFGVYGPMVVACAVSLLTFWFCWFLYRRKIFLRV